MCRPKWQMFGYGFLIASAFCCVAFSTQFSVLAYNVQMRPVLDDTLYKAENIGPRINYFDVVGLQESFDEKALLMESVRLPYQKHFTDFRSCLSIVDSGLSTVSRFPIVFTKTELYQDYAGFSDSIASKGVILTRLLIDGLYLDVYNTHMQAGDSVSENEARRGQAIQLVDFIKRHSTIGHSVLVIGDFNMSPQRRGRPFKDFHPNHYSNDRDMRERTASFQFVIDELGMTDVHDALLHDKIDDIERMLFRSGSNHDLRPLALAKVLKHFSSAVGKPLSDGMPLAVSFSLERKKVAKEH